MDIDLLEKTATAIKNGWPIPPTGGEPVLILAYRGKVQPKERPRKAANGHIYTPPKTALFESVVKGEAEAAMAAMGTTITLRPVAIHLILHDPISPKWSTWKQSLAKTGLIFKLWGGDTDNKEKAILDAINGVAYKDDKQVVQVFKMRRYAEHEGFSLTVTPFGFTETDVENIAKLLGASGYDEAANG